MSPKTIEAYGRDLGQFSAFLMDHLGQTPSIADLEVRPCLEAPDRYLLLVRWETLEAHTEGFRGSDRYQEWRSKLHGFYDPFPTVDHYGDPVASG